MGTLPWGHHRGDIAPCSQHLLPAQPRGKQHLPACLLPAGFCTLHMEGQAVPPPRVTSGSRSASSASNTIFWRFQGCRRKLFPSPVLRSRNFPELGLFPEF